MLLDLYFQQCIEWTKFAMGCLYNVKVKKKVLSAPQLHPELDIFRPEVAS